jgi:hypothetical protein
MRGNARVHEGNELESQSNSPTNLRVYQPTIKRELAEAGIIAAAPIPCIPRSISSDIPAIRIGNFLEDVMQDKMGHTICETRPDTK